MANASSPKGKCARRGRFLLPGDGWFVFVPLPFSPRGRLSCFASPVYLLAFLICSSSVDLFPPHASFFRLARSPAIACVCPAKKYVLRPPSRARASCARASRANNCFHLFTQCTQLLEIGCFAVKVNCRVLHFTFLSDRCKSLSFSKIR